MPHATQRSPSSACSNYWIWIIVVCWLGSTGCAIQPYRYGRFHTDDDERQSEVAIVYGRPQKTLDGIAWFTGLWSRLLPLNSNVNIHILSEESKEQLVTYLEENDLSDVLIRVNQYDPKGEWRRLRQNHRVSPGWRYTVGVGSMIRYTLIPGRVFGGDQYNAYTNTLYINSDVPAVVLHEAAYAKDVHSRSLPGAYAFANEFPFVSMWRHTNGVKDVLSYARANDDWLVERQTYRVVYPQMGVRTTAFGGTLLPRWDGILLSIAGAAAGHAAGQMAITQRTRERSSLSDEPDEPEELSQSDPDQLEPILTKQTSSEPAIQFTRHETESSVNK